MVLPIALARLIASSFFLANLPLSTACLSSLPTVLAALALIPAMFFGAASLFESAESMPRRHR